MSEYVILVAVEINIDGTREDAERYLHEHLNVMRRATAPTTLDPDTPYIECWWIAEDDRHDGSDNDSAVFVTPGKQRQARGLLVEHGLSPRWNLEVE